MPAPVRLRKPDESIPGLDLSLGEFWSWAYSDVLSNANRSVFAEFLVGAALGATKRPRVEWDAADLDYGGYLIEVKSSAYLQTWQQKRPSVIKFDIAKKRPWFAATNEYGSEPQRSAHVYVFCLYSEMDIARCDPLRVADWRFYVLIRARIDESFGDQKSVGLRRIQELAQPVLHEELRAAVDSACDEERKAGAEMAVPSRTAG